MYKITVYDYFSSAHKLVGYKGKCEGVHGHNWRVEIEVEGKDLDKIGMLIDFKEIKVILKGVIDELDHRMLNDIDAFKESNPSSELIARYIFQRIKSELPPSVDIVSTSVWESENSKASYYEI